VITYPDQARSLLVAHPQLAYALFQALLLNKIVDSAILQRMLEATAGGTGHTVPTAVPPPHLQHPLYPQMPYPAPPIQQPQPLPGMPPPPPPPMSVPPPSAMFSHHQPPPGMAPMPPYYRPPPPTQAHGPPLQAGQNSALQSMSQSTPDISESQRVGTPHCSCDITLIALLLFFFNQSMLMQVLSLTQEQINALPETERQAIVQLVSADSLPHTAKRSLNNAIHSATSSWALLACKAVCVATTCARDSPLWIFAF
jgi:cleavage stimulation factor subunit 2